MKSIKRFIIPVLIFLLSNFLQFGIHGLLTMAPETAQLLRKTGEVLFVVSIAWAIIVIIRIAKNQLLKNYDIDVPDNLKSRKVYTQYNILERIVIFVIIIISVAIILMLFESVRSVGVSIFASAGIAGLIIGLAAQKALGSILAGLQIAITQPIRLDDVVIVENEWGWIEEINLTYVVVRIWDKRRLVVPSTFFLDRPFQNWTRTSADILGTVFIYTDYTIPFEPLRKELTRLLESSPHWDGKVNVLQVTDAKESTLEIRALMSAETSPQAWDLRVFVREKLIEFIQKEYPQCLPRTRVELKEPDKPKTK
ncbi:MAG: mechanosensitive ion channel family protein [Bacteroidetes bacterium]|nr:MAG: mechanosensitive ion channel family protein [Bacteroidota bacterium]